MENRALARRIFTLMGPDLPHAKAANERASACYEEYFTELFKYWKKGIGKHEMGDIYRLAGAYTNGLCQVMNELWDERHGVSLNGSKRTSEQARDTKMR